MDYKTFRQALTLSEDLRASAIMAREAGEIVVWRLGGPFNTLQVLPEDILLYDGRKNPDDNFGVYDPPAVSTDVVLLMALTLYQADPTEFAKATSVN